MYTELFCCLGTIFSYAGMSLARFGPSDLEGGGIQVNLREGFAGNLCFAANKPGFSPHKGA